MKRSAVVGVAAKVSAITWLVALAPGCRPASVALVTLLPAEMQRSGPQTKEHDGAVALWGNGSLHADVQLEEGPINISIFARGTNFGGDWPKLHITLASCIVASVTIDSQVVTEYTVQVYVARSETSALDVALVNYARAPGQPLAGRNMLVQKITLRHA
jgi:hypothetical protein